MLIEALFSLTNTPLKLAKSEQLQNFADLGTDTVDTSDPDDKGQFRLSRYIVVPHFAGCAPQADLTPVHLLVLLVILLGPLVDQFPGHFASLFLSQKLLDAHSLHGGK